MSRIGGSYDVCPRHNKRRFESENEARLQLIRAQLVHTEEGRPRIEKRFYACELGGFHLTAFDHDPTTTRETPA